MDPIEVLKNSKKSHGLLKLSTLYLISNIFLLSVAGSIKGYMREHNLDTQ